MPKNVQTTSQLHLFHMLAKQCSKFSKLGFNSTWTKKFQIFKLDLEKADEPEIKLPTSVGPSIKQESFRKTSTSALLTTPEPLTVWITNCGKFFKRWNTRPATWLLRNLYTGQTQLSELDMKQQTGSKYRKDYVKAVYCHSAYLTYMERLSWEILD